MTKKSLIYAVFVLLAAFLLNLYPVDIEGLIAVHQANQTLKDGQSLAALNQYMAIIYHSPEKTYLYQRAGEAAFAAGEFELAKNYLELADNNNDLDEIGLLILGDVYQLNGNWKQAVNVWKKIDLNKQKINEVSARLLNVFINQSMWGDAELTLKARLKLNPDERETSEMLAWIEMFVDPEKARIVFNDLSAGTDNAYHDVSSLIDKYPAIKDDAQQVSIWWLEFGDLAVKNNHPDIALKAFEKSIEINEKYAVGWVKIAAAKTKHALGWRKRDQACPKIWRK